MNFIRKCFVAIGSVLFGLLIAVIGIALITGAMLLGPFIFIGGAVLLVATVIGAGLYEEFTKPPGD